jgi:hypothetical protein
MLPLGQTLIMIAGCGWVRREADRWRKSGPVTRSGSCQGEKYWHGATRTTGMTGPDGGQESTQCKSGTRQPWTGGFGYRPWLLGYERQPVPTEGAPRDDWAHRGRRRVWRDFVFHAGRAKGEPVLVDLSGRIATPSMSPTRRSSSWWTPRCRRARHRHLCGHQACRASPLGSTRQQ